MLPLIVLSPLALGAPPEALLPLVDRVSLPVAWSQEALARGVEGGASVPACRPFAEGLVVCLTVPAGEGRRLVTVADLEAWEVPQSEAMSLAKARMAEGITAARPEVVPIPDDPRTYLLSAVGDGLDQAALFHPAALAARFGGQPFAVGIPTRDVLIAMPLGDPELQQMVAVGVRRLWEGAEEPVSPAMYAWDGAAWQVWGEAQRVVKPDPALPTSPEGSTP
ncbi:MAG: hypothetical protein ABIO70_24090 [Pseudomonadota bacterium]